MKQVFDRLFIGDINDCAAPKPGDMAVIHACKNPCHAAAVGSQKLPGDHEHYLVKREGWNLYLNMIDPLIPLFKPALFTEAMAFAREAWEAGKTILFHCNKGESRSTSLAMMFIAKYLNEISNDTYAGAMADFEEVAPGVCKPGAGIRTYLTEHWHEFDMTGVRPAALPQAHPGPMFEQRTPETFEQPEITEAEADEIIAAVAAQWFESSATIRGRDGQDVSPPALQMNGLQNSLDEIISWCELNDVPCRVIILKPRKEGATTYLVAKCYHLLRSMVSHLLQIGDQIKTTETMWAMLKKYGDTDGFDGWPNTTTKFTSSARDGHASWSHGSTAWTDTAGDKRAGQSTTPTIIHAEEVAHWGKDGMVASASETMLALLNAIAEIADTYVFVSSTANGLDNWYHRTYTGAATFAERKAGAKGNGWIRLFVPWHASLWATEKITPEQSSNIMATLTASERRGRALWAWRPDQIAWRRTQITSKCDGDEAKFNQENPESEESAFIHSGRPRFDQDGVTRLLTQAKDDDARPVGHRDKSSVCTLEDTDGILTLLDDRQSGWLWMSERPIIGCRYVGFADVMTGEQARGSKTADAHACGILRSAYIDQSGVNHKAKLVAAIYVKDGCRWDMDILVDRHWRMLKFFGNPIIIPEANNSGVEYIRIMREKGASIWKRERHLDANPKKSHWILGFQTSPSTKSLWVDALASFIRESAIDCAFMPACREFATFVTNDQGTGEASGSNHDDWVSGIGLGSILLRSGAASVYLGPPSVQQVRAWQSFQQGSGLQPSSLGMGAVK